MINEAMEAAYKAGQATADSTYDEIIYGDLVPPWVFDDADANEFFEAGRNGYEMPQYVTGWRYGALPAGGRSRNYREDRLERGVSMMQIDGVDKVVTLSELNGLAKRDVVRVGGWLNPNDVGGDGEALLIAAHEIKE